MLTPAPAAPLDLIARFRQARAGHPYLSELIEGAIILGGSPRPLHNLFIIRLLALLQGLMPQGVWMIAPMDVHLDESNVVQPDLFWMSEGSACQEGPDGYYGPPDLVIEVLSPSTAKRDLAAKYRLYERAGVCEYWLADVDNRYIVVHGRDDMGRYALLDAYQAGETLISPTLGQSVPLPAALFDFPPPKPPTA